MTDRPMLMKWILFRYRDSYPVICTLHFNLLFGVSNSLPSSSSAGGHLRTLDNALSGEYVRKTGEQRIWQLTKSLCVK
jgi:hypothetical protein